MTLRGQNTTKHSMGSIWTDFACSHETSEWSGSGPSCLPNPCASWLATASPSHPHPRSSWWRTPRSASSSVSYPQHMETSCFRKALIGTNGSTQKTCGSTYSTGFNWPFWPSSVVVHIAGLVDGKVVGSTDIVRSMDRFRAKPKVANGHTTALLGIILEVGLANQIGKQRKALRAQHGSIGGPIVPYICPLFLHSPLCLSILSPLSSMFAHCFSMVL